MELTAGSRPTTMSAAIPDRTGTYITFDLGGQRFAVDVADVREILDHLEIAPMPGQGGAWCGVVDNRGSSVPVLDLASRLGLRECHDGSEDARIVIFELSGDGGSRAPVGVRADRVLNVCEIARDDIETPPRADRSGIAAVEGLARLDGRLVYMLDLAHAVGALARSI